MRNASLRFHTCNNLWTKQLKHKTMKRLFSGGLSSCLLDLV